MVALARQYMNIPLMISNFIELQKKSPVSCFFFNRRKQLVIRNTEEKLISGEFKTLQNNKDRDVLI